MPEIKQGKPTEQELQNQLVPSDIVQAIKDSVEIEVVCLNGEDYISRPVYLPPQEPQVKPLKLHTLSGMIDYVKTEEIDDFVVHVVSPTEVTVTAAPAGRYQDRPLYAIANCESIIGRGFRFGEYLTVEQFIVNLQAQFEVNEARSNILRVVGNIRQESVRTLSDDGVTQQVVASAGISRVGNAEIPNPVSLKPFRTFPEIAQPESTFVLRLQQGSKDGELPKCALFEADGGLWKLDAIHAIRDFLKGQLEDLTIVA